MEYDIIRRLFPRKLANHESFSIFVELASTELNKVFDAISVMATLSNIDRCPEVFIQHLGELVDFDWSPFLDSEVQRECIKHKWDTKKFKGTKEDLEYAATYGDIDGYQGGRLFVPGCDADLKVQDLEDLIYNDFDESLTIKHAEYSDAEEELNIPSSAYEVNLVKGKPNVTYSNNDYILFGESTWGEDNMVFMDSNNEVTIIDTEDNYDMHINAISNHKPRAIVTLPRESLFTFSKSEFDGDHYIPDNVAYKEGTILIEVTRLNDAIKNRVESVKPVGMLVVYKYVHDGTFEYITHTRTLSEVNL